MLLALAIAGCILYQKSLFTDQDLARDGGSNVDDRVIPPDQDLYRAYEGNALSRDDHFSRFFIDFYDTWWGKTAKLNERAGMKCEEAKTRHDFGLAEPIRIHDMLKRRNRKEFDPGA